MVKLHEDEKSTGKYSDVVIRSEQLGVYRLLLASARRESPLRSGEYFKDLRASIPPLLRLLTDTYAISPTLFAWVVLSKFWSGLEDASLMYISAKMLRAIEVGLTQGTPVIDEILWLLGLRLICTALAAYLSWLNEKMAARLRSRTIAYFDLYLMQVKSRLDIPTSLDASNTIEGTGRDAWSAFERIIQYLSSITTVTSQALLIYQDAHTAGGPIFVMTCLAKPIVQTFSYRALWDKAFVAYVNNVHYLRTKDLKRFTDGTFREDILSGDLSSWISQEYKTAWDQCGDRSDDHPLLQISSAKSPTGVIFETLLGEVPLAYYVLNAIIHPDRFSVTSIAILQSSSIPLRSAVFLLFQGGTHFKQNISTVKAIYAASQIQNKVVSGKSTYPSSEKASNEGMSMELRNVSFAYPGSHKMTNALENISLNIPGGALVVIVGANGSGKSTLVRILSRLFDPTSGEHLIDGRPAQEYNINDLRRATSLLSQDNKVYPMSFKENIGLGCVEHLSDMNLIKKAAEQGGAADFIAKLETGYSTKLENARIVSSRNLDDDPEHPLRKEAEKIEKKVNISGGETQRLVASRSFMRFNSGHVKYVAVDEPSSALDAEGELQLFNNLLKVREGKTMVIVTHRFGHLTKHANMIICLKDGCIAETGTHDDLMNTNGEYAKLYSIQANAFGETGSANS